MNTRRVVTGIPTTYGGQQFRSTLEASWAAFFDELEWPWEYEPYELDGYIPDFVLPFAAGPILVEIKPEHYLDRLKAQTGRLEGSTWEHEAIVVGSTPCVQESSKAAEPVLGWMAEEAHGAWTWGAGALFRCTKCRQWSIHHRTGSWHCRVNGCGDGNRHVAQLEPHTVMRAWRSAHSKARWRPQRRPLATDLEFE